MKRWFSEKYLFRATLILIAVLGSIAIVKGTVDAISFKEGDAECLASAQKSFESGFDVPKSSFESHFNRRLRQCFMLVKTTEYEGNLRGIRQTLINVSENRRYQIFFMPFDPKEEPKCFVPKGEKPITSRECGAIGFNYLVKEYMENEHDGAR